VSLHAIAMSIGEVEEVHFVLFGTPTFTAYINAGEQAVTLLLSLSISFPNIITNLASGLLSRPFSRSLVSYKSTLHI